MCPSMKTNNGLLQVQCGALDWLIVRLGTAIFGPVPLFATIPYFVFPVLVMILRRSRRIWCAVTRKSMKLCGSKKWLQFIASFSKQHNKFCEAFRPTAFRSSFLLPNSFRKRIPTNEFPNSLPWTCFFIELRPSNFSSFFYLCGLAF